MEVMIFIIFFSLVFITTFALWKYVRLKHDVYEYTEKLDNTINYMLKNGELKTTPYENDDLWEKIYEKLVRLSHLYTHKNLEISEEKDKLKELVSDISHQTKTSIANIKLYLEIMTDESDFKKNQEYMRKMNGQIDKLDFLLQSMVKMSRLETGTIKIQKQNVLLADTLAMAISNVVIKADKKNIKIDVQYDEQLMLKHDKKWTAEAIFNILDNAVKYTEVGGNIHVVVCRQELFTKISIEDTGKGIAPERQATIFTRFYREPEVHDKEGIGIGLYLAREIITLQNGYIEVQSQIGQTVADLIDITPAHMSNVETGKTKVSLPTLIAIANALSVSVDTLLCDNVIASKIVFEKEAKDIFSDCDEYEVRFLVDLMKSAKIAFRKDKDIRNQFQK
ncbi:ATP-binding protein [Dorea formicigenerans]|uniref:ATP-binding protein n=1 Tax=Dorea formicigenerans TaxID=39486 RepID=UPI00156E4654|nr:helix-turn-helix domain-containing protein [Dorea formicigenerans]